MKIHLIGGARPNFVKLAPLWRAFRAHKRSHPASRLAVEIVNTGQHYDYWLSRKMFKDLGLPKPAVDLGVGSGSHASQTAKVMTRYERFLVERRPDLVIVVGDVNSTLACSLVAVKAGIPVAHVESGLRSFDRGMPEEINRMVTDRVSDILFTSCADADRNLLREGVPREKIFFVGNVMVDSLFACLEKAARSTVKKRLGLERPYALMTLHRPSNVDRDLDFIQIVRAVEKIQERIKIVFPVHPRTAERLRKGALGPRLKRLRNFILIPPLGYLDFIHLTRDAALVLTDSGGIQEETTALGVPCLTLRDNTERPVTIVSGTNRLVGRKTGPIVEQAMRVLNRKDGRKARLPALWDGKTAGRIVRLLARKFLF